MKVKDLQIKNYEELEFNLNPNYLAPGNFSYNLSAVQLEYVRDIEKATSFIQPRTFGTARASWLSAYANVNSYDFGQSYQQNNIKLDASFRRITTNLVEFSDLYNNNSGTIFINARNSYESDYMPKHGDFEYKIKLVQKTLTSPQNVTITGGDIRNGCTVTWTGPTGRGLIYEVVIKSGSEIIFESEMLDTNTRSLRVQPQQLQSGKPLTATVTAYALAHFRGNWYGKFQSNFFSTYGTSNTVTLTEYAPKVLSLEPSGVEVNKDKPVVVSWSSNRQETYTLNVNGTIYSGTTEKTITLPPRTLKANNTMTLIVKNVVGGVEDSDSKTVTFRAYGKPSPPVLDEKTVYGTATPTFNWESTEQVSYRVKIVNGGLSVIDTNEVAGTAKSYTSTKPLTNNTNYTVQVAVKNEKGLWSEFASKNIRISFSVLPAPRISLSKDNQGNIIVNVTNNTNSAFSRAEIWRKTNLSDWVRMAINLPLVSSFRDSTVASETVYYYKAMAYTQAGGVTESEVKSIKVTIPRSFFVNVENLQSEDMGYTLSHDPSAKFKRIVDKELVHYDGKRAPDVERGIADYTVASFAVAFKDYAQFKKFEHFAEKAKLLLFRDKSGRKLYGHITDWGDEEEIAVGYVKTSFTFTESHFIETDVYDGGRVLRLIRLDEGWKLDSDISLDMLVYGE